MTQPAFSSFGASRRVRIGLVAGPKTVAHLGPVIRHLIIGLLDEPMQVTLICPENVDLRELHLPCPPVDVVTYSLPLLPFLRRRALRELAEELKPSEVSLLHALDADAIPVTISLSENLGLDYLLWMFTCCREVPAADPRCRGILAASAPIQRTLLDSHLVREDQVHLLRPGVYQARSATCFVNPSHAAAIVAAGPLDMYASPAATLQTFADLKSAGRECVFFLVGNGKAERPLRRHAEKLGLMDELTFVDWTGPEQLTDIIKAADLFVSPVVSDRVEIDLLAAMAGGVPVLVADGSVADFVIPDQTALVFPAGDSARLTELVASLLDNRVMARELAEKALLHLRENHSPARMVARLADIYRGILGL